MEFTYTIRKGEKFYIATCKEIGTVSQGKTKKEALENIKEATECYLESFPLKKKKLKEDLEFAKRVEKAWISYDKGNFKPLSADKFLKELENK